MVFDKVRAVVAAQMNISEDKISENSRFLEDLGADSLDLFQIISDLEEEYDIEFKNEDAKTISTVIDAAKYIERVI